MKNKITLFFAFLSLACVSAFGQTAITQTTLSGALTSTATSLTVASATGIIAPSFAVANQPNANLTVLFVDKEEIFVTGLNGTYIQVTRGFNGTTAKAHNSGAVVFVAYPHYLSQNEQSGACVATNIVALPVINSLTGHIFTCGSSGQWAQVLDGTQTSSAGQTIQFLCSGTVGSAETEYVSSTVACSGSTTELLRWTATVPGTVANLRVSSTGNFLGTGGSILTVRKNGAAVTGFTCAPTAATKACANMMFGLTDVGTVGSVDSVSVVPGDTIDVSFLSATSDTAANLSVQLSVY